MTVPRLKIAVVAPPWFPVPPTGYGGIESVCAGLVDGLVERGHDVTLIGAGRDETDATRFFAATGEPQSDRVGDALAEVRHAVAASQVIGDLDVDVIHDHTAAGPLVAAGLEIPTVVTAHGPVDGELGDYYEDLSRYYRDLGERISFVSISNSQRAAAAELPWAATVYNGIRVSDHDFRRDKDDFVLFIGRCCADKAPELAVRAARDAGRKLVALTKCREPDEKDYFEQVVEPLLGSDVEWLEEPPKERKHDLAGAGSCTRHADPMGGAVRNGHDRSSGVGNTGGRASTRGGPGDRRGWGERVHLRRARRATRCHRTRR